MEGKRVRITEGPSNTPKPTAVILRHKTQIETQRKRALNGWQENEIKNNTFRPSLSLITNSFEDNCQSCCMVVGEEGGSLRLYLHSGTR